MHKIVEEDILTGRETLVRKISDEEVSKKTYVKHFSEPTETILHCNSCGTDFPQIRPTTKKERRPIVKCRRLQPNDEDFKIESREYYWRVSCPKCGTINVANFIVEELCYPWWINPPVWCF